eukprot:scaffold2381_cov128-Cylindrotheca_fusiformis.AAC.1
MLRLGGTIAGKRLSQPCNVASGSMRREMGGRVKISGSDDAAAFLFSSELTALVGHLDPVSAVVIPPGHYRTPKSGLVYYFNPDWFRKDDCGPWKNLEHTVTYDEDQAAFTKAGGKRRAHDNVDLWEGGAEVKSGMYAREGSKNATLLSRSLQHSRASSTSVFPSARAFSTIPVQTFDKEAYDSALASGYSVFEASLTLGGDDRSLINEKVGTNKYHIKPQPVDPAHVFRGSCTGNPPTRRGYDASIKLFNRLAALEVGNLSSALEAVFDDQRERLSKLLDLPMGSEIVLCPSGSDAEYIPLAIVRAIKGDVHIANGIAQLREIGAGSAPASVGKYFSTHAPLVGRLPSDAEFLDGFDGIDGATILARDKDGLVVDASQEMEVFMKTAFSNGSYPIVHGVFGGKTGLRDSTMPGSMDSGDKSLGVVDACQARFSIDELHQWLEQDSVVLFTASKFYQAPPFCGAVIIPSRIAEKLSSSSIPSWKEMFSRNGLGGFLTDKELPPCLDKWAPLLRNENTNNVGLALRWEAGLAGMDALGAVPDGVRTNAVEEWAAEVSGMVNREEGLDAWCVERSIVSIRVRKDEGWLSMSELRDLYRWMSMDISSLVPEATAEEKEVMSKPTYIGQPVDVSDTHAIVRIALGVESLVSYLDDKVSTLEEDRLAVKKLAAIGKHFEHLKKTKT